MRYLFAAALLLLPLSLRAQDSLIGQWKVDPSQIEQVKKAIEPVITSAQAKMQTPAEKEKIRDTLTAAFTGQRFAFIKSDDGIWEQEMFTEGAKSRFPITLVKTGKGETYEVHRAGKVLFIVSLFDAEHLTFASAKSGLSFPMIRDSDSIPSEGPKATTRSAGLSDPTAAPKP